VQRKDFAFPGGSRSGWGRSAMRVAVRVGRGKLVIVIVQTNRKQESCI
jgi:hypothetical protein